MQPWATQLQRSYRSVQDLAAAGLLSTDEAARLGALAGQYEVQVTPYYAGLIETAPPKGDDPIRLQAIPGLGEQDPTLPEWARGLSLEIFGRPEPWTADAIGDVSKLAAPRLTHRYGNRAILHLSTKCAVACRFCFRKSHLNERESQLYDGSLDPALDYLARTPAIRELILTGGDPLSLPDASLARLLDRVATMPHVRTVRIHTRMPVTLPSRITDNGSEGLLAALAPSTRPYAIALASHFNHPRELAPQALAALKSLRLAGITLLNQSVLLAGVNDSVDPLEALFMGLYEAGVVPFYLHHPDWTPGTFAFRVSVERGRALMRELRGRVSGPALPRYVLDLPGGDGKVPLEDASSVRQVLARDEDGLAAAVYEIDAPATRFEAAPSTRDGSAARVVRYLDLTSSRR